MSGLKRLWGVDCKCGREIRCLTLEQVACEACGRIWRRGKDGGPVLEQDVATINHPPHYGGDTPYEAIKVIEAWGLGFCLGNTVKYIARAGKKSVDHLEDLRKARWYLDREITNLEGPF